MNFRRLRGQAGERRAAEFLFDAGFEILDQNFHAREGEVDLVCRDDQTIVFVEVKLRTNEKFGAAAEAVDERKLQKIAAAGEKWLIKNSLENAAWRVDVVAIDGERIEHFRGV